MPGEASKPILTVNAGSSSIKLGLFAGHPLGAVAREQFELMPGQSPGERVLEWLSKRGVGDSLRGVGHRLVHPGFKVRTHQVFTPELVADLRLAAPLDPEHLPAQLELVERCERALPGVPQIACFDSEFFRELPRAATLLPIPRAYDAKGVRRYGFHGLVYEHVMEELGRAAGARAAAGKLILAHLGSGASMAAVEGGKPIDTTMAFTPAAGLVMGRRPGDLDPGVLVYLARSEGMDAEALDALVNGRCGLLGMSETSADVRKLLKSRETDPRAAEAIEVFCRIARKTIGALAAAMGGVEGLVFSGGIGENSAPIRSEICAGLEFLGVRLDAERNSAGEPMISASNSGVQVRIVRADEESVIARHVERLVGRAPV